MPAHSVIRSVNWHLISTCNYSCRFCFARNLGEQPVSFSEGLTILSHLADAGMEKINFAGGEPLLHPRLFDYCRAARDLGMTVSITTNGSLLSQKLIGEHAACIDWIALSVDSASESTEKRLGRGYGQHVRHCIDLSEAVREAGIRLKINTTVTRLTWEEDMADFIQRTSPEDGHADSDALVSQLVGLKYIEMEDAVNIVQPMLHGYGKVQRFDRINSLLLTETSSNLRRIFEILEMVDQPTETRVETRVYEIKHAKASEIASRLNELISDSEKKEEVAQVAQPVAEGTAELPIDNGDLHGLALFPVHNPRDPSPRTQPAGRG